MKYLIMLIGVIGLAAADILTGIIRAYLRNDISSSKLRSGGLNKLCELIVMMTACGIEICIGKLGQYVQSPLLAEITGTAASVLVFAYITVMELISVLENYAEISPDAVWVRGLIRRLRRLNRKENADVHTETDKT